MTTFWTICRSHCDSRLYTPRYIDTSATKDATVLVHRPPALPIPALRHGYDARVVGRMAGSHSRFIETSLTEGGLDP